MRPIISNFESLSEKDISAYAGEWIAVVKNKIVIHGKSFREVYTFVKKNYPKDKPLIGKLPEAIPIVLSLN
ncbi:hypothetical protein HZA33_00860 [Candidatus Pacearchaeota archaeon]|nr:hypothetical protein [Candidatus Pacearchaeota archaeon]